MRFKFNKPWFFTTILLLISISNLFSQKRKYEGMGAVNEIIMPAQARTIGHFSLFYEATLPDDSSGLQPFWYKIVFNSDCEFKFNLFPVAESDRYDFSLLKIEGDINFCEAAEKGKVIPFNDIKTKRTWDNNEQSESFRSNLVFTKTIPVKKGDVIYIELIHLWGPGEGHIIDFTTCDYSYVLKAVKSEFAIAKKDSSQHKQATDEEKNNLSINRIKKSLCPLSGKAVQLSSISFNEKTVNIQDKFSGNGEIKNSAGEIQNEKHSPAKNETINLKCVLSDTYSGEFIKTPPCITDVETQQKIYPEQRPNSINEFELKKNKKYILHCADVDYKGYDVTFETTNSLDNNEILQIQMEPIVYNKNKLLQTFYFYPNSTAIKPESVYELNKLKEFLKNNPQAIIEIAGHSNGNQFIKPEKIIQANNPDWIFEGSSRELSLARANKIKQQLVAYGINIDRIQIKSYGGDKPIYSSTKSWDELKKNMRVEVSLIN